MVDIDTLLDNPHRAETTVLICLRRDLEFRWHELNQELEQLDNEIELSDESEKLADAGMKELRKKRNAQQVEMDRIAQEAQDSTIPVRLRDIADKWWELVEAHPPREGVNADQSLNANYQTFPRALISASMVEPELNDTQREKFFAALSTKHLERLLAAAMAVTRGEADIPFSSAVSPTTTNGAPKSRRQSDSASASNASQGGSLAKPQSTSTTTGD